MNNDLMFSLLLLHFLKGWSLRENRGDSITRDFIEREAVAQSMACQPGVVTGKTGRGRC